MLLNKSLSKIHTYLLYFNLALILLTSVKIQVSFYSFRYGMDSGLLLKAILGPVEVNILLSNLKHKVCGCLLDNHATSPYFHFFPVLNKYVVFDKLYVLFKV